MGIEKLKVLSGKCTNYYLIFVVLGTTFSLDVHYFLVGCLFLEVYVFQTSKVWALNLNSMYVCNSCKHRKQKYGDIVLSLCPCSNYASLYHFLFLHYILFCSQCDAAVKSFVFAVDQADTCLPKDPPQYKHIAGITLPCRHHSHWPANQDHIKRNKEQQDILSSAQRMYTWRTDSRWHLTNHMHAFQTRTLYIWISVYHFIDSSTSLQATQWPKLAATICS